MAQQESVSRYATNIAECCLSESSAVRGDYLKGPSRKPLKDSLKLQVKSLKLANHLEARRGRRHLAIATSSCYPETHKLFPLIILASLKLWKVTERHELGCTWGCTRESAYI
ncbi:hypothetical protein E3N88_30918 [Mikania micrantha]|uniref:Uncharacterized protein n=1 Tax=Mikania micrantha TaxID=192012 RepID=A0A5N6MQY7_9ASTR|nr:hypothetical protein E3N88_30918 [Mikania micrantha]